jgi:hypothetical protein
MNKEELKKYILNRKYFCCFCAELQKKVKKEGVDILKDYGGMICVGVEDMLLRYHYLGKELPKPINLWDLL